MEDESRAPAWHTIVAALFAVGALGAVLWTGWGALRDQVTDVAAATPQQAAERFMAAINDEQPEGLIETAAGEPDTFLEVLASATEPLEPRQVMAQVDDITEDGPRAEGVLTWTMTGGPADGGAWTSTLALERRRGEWQPVLGLATIHPDLRTGWTFQIQEQVATRNPILDVDGTPLTTGADSVVIGIEPRKIISTNRLLDAWLVNLPDSYEDLEELLDRDDLRPTWFYPVATITSTRFADVEDELDTIPGVVIREAQDASADDPFAIHVLGRVGEPTAEMVAAGATEGEPVGLYGLQAVYEADLVTGASATIVLVETDGDIHEEITTLSADDVRTITTTLHLPVQQALENVLLATEDRAAIVVLDTADAAIRGSASRPETGYNRAFEGRYTPGDAILPVMVDALVAAGVGMGTSVTCPPEDVVAGAQLTAPRPDDDTTVAAALGALCDTTIGALAADLDDDVLVGAAERYGFGTDISLPLPVASSSYPTPADTTERVRASVGQAQVLTSPLHVASVLAAAVTGTWRAPYLLVDEPGGPGTALTSGTGGAMAEVLTNAEDVEGVGVLAGTAVRSEDGGQVTDAWALAVVDDLAVVVLVEDVGDERPARDLMALLVAELG